MAKKKARKKPVQPGVDVNEQRRQRLEARREAKAAAAAAARRREQRETWIRRVLVVLFLGTAIWFLFLRPGVPDEIGGYTVSHFSTEGANQHTGGDVEYETSPPVSGAHDPQPAACGTYAQPLDDEQMVHTLEHGGVGLVYSPELGPEAIAELEGIVRSYDSHVFSVPYLSEMETPLAITAWGHMMRLEDVDRPAIEEFVDEFRQEGGDAPEGFQDCDNSQNQSFQAETQPDAEATPGAEESPAPEGEESPEPEASASE